MIKGFIGTTLLDYPGKPSFLIFIGGCNWRCPFCHNADLVLPEKLKEQRTFTTDEIVSEIKKRMKLIKAVSITGGEPTMWNGFADMLKKIKDETSLPIKTDTNGSFPDRIKHLIENNLIDYIAMDIKTSPEKYPEAIGGVNGFRFEILMESVNLIMSSGIPYEFRTTLVPNFVDEQVVETIAKDIIKDAELYVLQQFRPLKTLDPSYQNLHQMTPDRVEKLKETAEPYVKKVEVRG